MAKATNVVVTAETSESKRAAEKTLEKVHEKVVEKRRALGRGLDSLLPGPRVVTTLPAAPSSTAAASTPPVTTEGKIAELRAEGEEENPLKPNAGLGGAASVDLISGGMQLGAGADTAVHLHVRDDVAVPRTEVEEDARRAAMGESVSVTPEGEVFRLDIELIDDNPHQTRMFYKTEALEEMAQSIRVHGVLQPVVVRPAGDGRYKLILGERRLRASQMAGMETVPAIVKRVNEQQAAEMTLVENLQREDLNCVEQAGAFSELSKRFNLTQEEIGKRVGLSREAVANYMRLLSLPSGVLEALVGGRLTFSHARALMPLKDQEQIWSLAKRAIEENLKVSELEDVVRGVFVPHGHGSTGGTGARWVDPNVKAAQRSLEEVLGMRVRISDRHGRGKIVISYETIDDFDRVVEMLRGK
jgi:ParB family chromosome partitioning protein